jgi:Ran GTPase-activating protein (RanGAP) involved in mRNA processing and transport
MSFKGGFVSPAKLVEKVENNDAGLTELDLSDNSSYKMKTREFTKKIGDALKTNTNLKKLILKGLEIDDAAASSIADGLAANKSLEILVLEKNKIGSAGAEAIANALKSNATLTELNLLSNKEFGESCLLNWINCFEYNVTLTKIIWRLNSRQSFSINKCIARNVEIQKKLKEGKNVDNLIPKNCVALSRTVPVAEHKVPSSDDQSSSHKEEPKKMEPEIEQPAQKEQEQPAQKEHVKEESPKAEEKVEKKERTKKELKADTRCESGKTWIVENYKGNKELKLDNVEHSQAVRLFNLTDCVIQIQGKFTALSITNCKKLGVQFSSVIGSVEINRTTSLQIEYTENGSNIFQVDQSDSISIFLKEGHTATEIVTAKCSEVNLIENGESESKESSIPSQFITTYDEQLKKWITRPTDHVGA